MIRAVVDTNVLVSGIISEQGTPRQIVNAWHQRQFTLLTSALIIAEVVRVLHYPHLQMTYHLSEEDILLVRDALLNDALVLEDMYQVMRSRDPQDNLFLACALEGHADYLVSGDAHLLEIKYYHGVQIVAPRQFLDLLKANTATE
jgi:putative PIN family toxin of toxin-antitoxin system